MSDPLFDPTQKGDEDLVALERLLSTQRYKSPEKSWERRALAGPPLGKSGRRVLGGAVTLLAAAVVAFFYFVPKADGAWRIGQTRSTGSQQHLELALNGIGTLNLEPDTTVKLLASSPTEQRVQLDRGTVHAKVNAPPRVFMVDTPVARAVDLGCEYTLHVAGNHRTERKVTFGRVALEDGRNSVTVYAGFETTQSPKSPPRVPWPSDATPELEELIRQADVERDAKALDQLIHHPCDVTKHCLGPFEQQLALWHLAFRLDTAGRKAAIEKLSEAVPPPAELDVDAFELSAPAMQKWLDALFTH